MVELSAGAALPFREIFVPRSCRKKPAIDLPGMIWVVAEVVGDLEQTRETKRMS